MTAIEPTEILDPSRVDLTHNPAYAQDPESGGGALEQIHPPGVLATVPELLEFTDRWLANRELSDHTRIAYRRDLEGYLTWCHAAGLRPLEARFTHVNEFSQHLRRAGLSPHSRNRALSAVSSWYDFLLRLEAIDRNPVDGADRAKVDRSYTNTVGFSVEEAAAIVVAARADKPLGALCATALAETMVALGARVTELCLARVEDLGYADGHRVLKLERMKGGRKRTRPLPPAAVAAIDAMLEARSDRDDPQAPLFVDSSGKPLDRHMVYRFVRRAARVAGVPSAAKITPHSFRHAWATAARLAKASLEARQYALGHADPRTTQGYDRAKLTLDTDPAYLVAAAVAEAGTRVREDGPMHTDQAYELAPSVPASLEVVRDRRLSFVARGIMHDLMAEPRPFTAESLVADRPASEALEEVRDALLELESVDYIHPALGEHRTGGSDAS